MSYRHILPLLLTIPATAATAQAAGFSCDFTEFCYAGAPCMTLQEPMRLDLDPQHGRYAISIDIGTGESKDHLYIAGEPRDGKPLFLVGMANGYYFRSLLLSIRPDGAAWLTIHRSKPFGEFETRRGICQPKE